MQHIDDHDPLGNEPLNPLNKRAIASPTNRRRKPMKPKPKKVAKKQAKPAAKQPLPAGLLPPVLGGKSPLKQSKGKAKGLPPWLVATQKKRSKKAGKVG